MLRYYLIATVIVVLVGATVVAQRWLRGELNVASVQVRVSPRPDYNRDATVKKSSNGIRYEHAGALSTLPDCVLQTGFYRGTRTFVNAHLPAHGAALLAGTHLHLGACTIEVRADDLIATRGADRVRVTPHARLFPIAGGYLIDLDRGTMVEARSYRVVSNGAHHP